MYIRHHVELAFPVVVVACLGLTDLDPVVIGKLFEFVVVVVQLHPIRNTGLGHKKVHSERAGGCGTRGSDIVG